MKKKLFYIACAGCCAAISIFSLKTESDTLFADFTLQEVEAIAGCETSSDPSNNKGYCVSNYGSPGDSCVSNSDSDAVRCSGNI